MSLGSNLYADQSVENIIKGRKALFSKNYNTAKRVQAFSRVVNSIKQMN